MYITNVQQMHGTSLEYAHITSYSPSKHPIIARDPLKDKGATPETWHHAIRIVANLSWVFCFCFCFFFSDTCKLLCASSGPTSTHIITCSIRDLRHFRVSS
jgi:hypothetical protein